MKVLLLPGLDGTGKLSKYFCTALADKFEAAPLAYPESASAFAEYAQFAARSIMAEGDVALVAESFSGPVAIEVLRNPPPNSRAVILVATFAKSPVPLLLKLTLWVPAALMRLFSGVAVERFCLNGNNDEALATQVKNVVQSLPATLIKKRLNILLSLPDDLCDVLARTELPVFFLRPTSDRLLPEKYFAEIEQFMSHGATYRIDGPHFLLQCQAPACAHVIGNIVSRLA